MQLYTQGNNFAQPIPSFFNYAYVLKRSSHHDHLISPLGCLGFRLDESCGAVPLEAGEAATDLDCSRSFRPFSFLFFVSSLTDTAASDDREPRSIDVRGSLLLAIDPVASTLVLLVI